MRYFELFSDESDDAQWFLGTPILPDGTEVNVWAFTMCKPFALDEPLVVPIREPGEPREISFGAFDVPYVSPSASLIFGNLAPEDTQRVPAALPNGGRIDILNILHYVDCLDHDRSTLTYDKAGKVNMVLKLRIDPTRVGRYNAFRISDWHHPFIVSERLLKALGRIDATGWVAIPVS